VNWEEVAFGFAYCLSVSFHQTSGIMVKKGFGVCHTAATACQYISRKPATRKSFMSELAVSPVYGAGDSSDGTRFLSFSLTQSDTR